MSEYEIRVKKRLIDLGKNQTWLIGEIRSKTGLYCDSAYMSRIVKEKSKPPKIRAAIDEILGFSEG